jgi:hypothetical protein
VPTVPPGHKVIVVRPASEPRFSRTPSGPWVLNFGAPAFVASGLATVTKFLRTNTERTSVIWLMTGEILPAFDAPTLLQRVEEIHARSSIVRHFAVFPDEHRSRLLVMAKFKGFGFGVHFGGPGRECYVEVHKPDGSITVGMPGPAFVASD